MVSLGQVAVLAGQLEATEDLAKERVAEGIAAQRKRAQRKRRNSRPVRERFNRIQAARRREDLLERARNPNKRSMIDVAWANHYNAKKRGEVSRFDSYRNHSILALSDPSRAKDPGNVFLKTVLGAAAIVLVPTAMVSGILGYNYHLGPNSNRDLLAQAPTERVVDEGELERRLADVPVEDRAIGEVYGRTPMELGEIRSAGPLEPATTVEDTNGGTTFYFTPREDISDSLLESFDMAVAQQIEDSNSGRQVVASLDPVSLTTARADTYEVPEPISVSADDIVYGTPEVVYSSSTEPTLHAFIDSELGDHMVYHDGKAFVFDDEGKVHVFEDVPFEVITDPRGLEVALFERDGEQFELAIHGDEVMVHNGERHIMHAFTENRGYCGSFPRESQLRDSYCAGRN